jgi:pantothenate kinase type III
MLLVDVGNTRIKWELRPPDGQTSQGACLYRAEDLVRTLDAKMTNLQRLGRIGF